MIKNKDIIVLLIRLLLGYIFFAAGICKLTHGQFGQLIGPPMLEDWLATYGLSLFAQFIAACQVLCGALLLSQRYSTFGAVMLVPMNLSILAVTISLHWNGTPYVNAFFLILNLLILLYDWKKFQFLFLPAIEYTVKNLPLDKLRNSWYTILTLIFAILTLIAAPVNYIFTNIFAILTFTSAGLTVCRPDLLMKSEKLATAQIIANMIIITLANYIPFASKIVLVNTAIMLGVLFVGMLIRRKKSIKIMYRLST